MSKSAPATKYVDPYVALAQRLTADESADTLALGSANADDAISSIRNSTTRELLRASPVAARRLRQVVESGSDKDAIAAANVIFSKSPATPLPANTLSGASFSAEALEILFNGLATFASAGAGARSARAFDTSPVEVTIVEES